MLTLILGGARSGKSDLAQRLAIASVRDVLFLATMQPGDDETRARVAAHRAERPPAWQTIEEPLDIVRALDANAPRAAFVIVDCLTLWITNLLLNELPGDDADGSSLADAARALDVIRGRTSQLLDWAAAYDGEISIVSNEVGMGVVPAYPLGRIFRDALGSANRTIAEGADRVYYLVAGLALEMKSLGALPLDAFGEARTR